MNSKTPETETFDKKLYGLFYAAVQMAHLAGCLGKGWNPHLTYEDILAAHTTALEAAKREARIEELQKLLSDSFVMGGMNMLRMAAEGRILALSHPNQPKENK